MDFSLFALNIDQWIVVVFLVATLIIGIISGLKIKTVQDYTIGEKGSFSTSVIAMTLIATMIGGNSTIGNVSEIFQYGYAPIIVWLGYIIGLILLAKFVASKFDKRFDGMLSSADIIQKFYGIKAGKFTGVIGVIFGIGALGAQITALGHFSANFLNLDYQISVMFVGGIVVLYSVFGGIRSVAITDIIQFLILAVGIPIIANLCFQKIGSIDNIISGLSTSHTRLLDHENSYNNIMSFLFYLLPFAMLSPPLVQRYLMADNASQLSKITYLYSFIAIALLFMMACIALSAVTLIPDIEPNSIIPYVINKLLPTGLKGLAMAGMVAVIMSTADSVLNTSGILLTLNTFFKSNESDAQKMRLMKLNTLTVGITSIFIALQNIQISTIIIVTHALLVTTTIPLFIKIIGLDVSKEQFWANVAVGFVIFAIAEFGCSLDIKTCAFISTISSILAFIITHLIQNSRRFKYDYYNGEQRKQLLDKPIIEIIKDCIPTLDKLANYSVEKVKDIGAPYQLFGIFTCVNYVIPYFMWSFDKFPNQEYIAILRFIAGGLCVGLIMADQWGRKVEKYLPLYWYFTVMFCLPFMTTVMFFSTQGQHGWLLNMSLAIFFLAILTDWKTFIILNIIGFILGFGFYKFCIDIPSYDLSTQTIYLIIYTFIFSISIGILFSRKKEIKNNDKLRIMKLFGTSMAHEIKTPIGQLSTVLSTLKNCHHHSNIEKSDDEILIRMPQKLYQVLNQNLSSYNHYVKESHEVIDHLLISAQDSIREDDFEWFKVSEIIDEVTKGLPPTDGLKITYTKENDLKIFAPKIFIKHVVINLIKNACKYALPKEGSTLQITIHENKIIFHDTGFGINADKIDKIFDQFYSSDRAGTGLGLAFCKMVMESIDGEIDCVSEEGKFTTFTLTFPWRNIQRGENE